MTERVIRFLGLKGSWKWACKQLDKGLTIRPLSATGSVKYRLDLESQRRIQWTFSKIPISCDWGNANIFLSDFEKTDWMVVK